MGLINDSNHVATVCQPGSPGCCRYLTIQKDGWDCLKLNPQIIRTLQDVMDGVPATKTAKQLLDDRVAAGTIRARGDNCEGR